MTRKKNVKLCESFPKDYDMITYITEDMSCKEGLIIRKARTVIFSEKQGWSPDSTENKETEDTFSNDKSEKNLRFPCDLVSTANVVSKEIRGKA